MHQKKTTWIAVTGLMWLGIGILLLTKGLHLIVYNSLFIDSWSFRLAPWVGSRDKGALALITLGLIVGFFKGRYVFVKTVRRVVSRILQLPVPLKISQIYSKQYVILILSMVCLGISLKWAPIPQELRGIVDVAIGSALMNGAFLYFRLAFTIHREISK